MIIECTCVTHKCLCPVNIKSDPVLSPFNILPHAKLTWPLSEKKKNKNLLSVNICQKAQRIIYCCSKDDNLSDSTVPFHLSVHCLFSSPVHYVFFKVFLVARIRNVRIITVKHWKEMKLLLVSGHICLSGEILLGSLHFSSNVKHAPWPRWSNKSRKVAVQKQGRA